MSAVSTGRRTSLVVLVLGTLLVGGVAAAYWATTGSGSAPASSSTTTPVTLTSGTPAAQLYPGGQADVTLKVTNPNPASVRVGSLALDTGQGAGGFGVDGGHLACPLTALSFATQANGGAGWTVPASGTLAVTLTNALSMTTTAASACQGATFTVYLKAAS